MIRKFIFITIVVLLLFFLYRGISPSGADKILNNISALRQKNINKINKTGYITSETNSSGKNSYDKLTQSGTLKNLTGISDKNTTTGSINILNQRVSTGKTIRPNTTTNTIQTNTNGLSAQDMADLKNLLNNVVE